MSRFSARPWKETAVAMQPRSDLRPVDADTRRVRLGHGAARTPAGRSGSLDPADQLAHAQSQAADIEQQATNSGPVVGHWPPRSTWIRMSPGTACSALPACPWVKTAGCCKQPGFVHYRFVAFGNEALHAHARSVQGTSPSSRKPSSSPIRAPCTRPVARRSLWDGAVGRHAAVDQHLHRGSAPCCRVADHQVLMRRDRAWRRMIYDQVGETFAGVADHLDRIALRNSDFRG